MHQVCTTQQPQELVAATLPTRGCLPSRSRSLHGEGLAESLSMRSNSLTFLQHPPSHFRGDSMLAQKGRPYRPPGYPPPPPGGTPPPKPPRCCANIWASRSSMAMPPPPPPPQPPPSQHPCSISSSVQPAIRHARSVQGGLH